MGGCVAGIEGGTNERMLSENEGKRKGQERGGRDEDGGRKTSFLTVSTPNIILSRVRQLMICDVCVNSEGMWPNHISPPERFNRPTNSSILRG